MNWTQLIGIIILATIFYFAISWSYRMYAKMRLKSVGGQLEAADFEARMRKGQLIDTRMKNEFDAGHILGARSIPVPEFKQMMGGLRKDLPVYLYDAVGITVTSAALKLKKAGFEHVYFLKGGYENWSGKTKKTEHRY